MSTAPIHPDRIDGTFAPVIGAWVTAVELDGECVLYDETNGVLHLLDAVATVAWARLDGTVTLDDLAVELSATFATDASRVRGDLVAFARQLGHQHLLEGVTPPPSAAGSGDPASAAGSGDPASAAGSGDRAPDDDDG